MRRMLLSLVAGVALAVPAAAQTVDELIARSFAARGGLDKLEAVKAVRMTGTMRMGGMELPIVVEIKRPANMRTELSFQGSPVVQAFDGTQGWAIAPMDDGKPQALPAAAAKEMAPQADLDGPLADYKAKGHQVELVGKEPVDGKDAYKLELTRSDGYVEHYFLDAASLLPIRVDSERTIEGQTIQGEARNGDYREVGGLLWPHLLENGAKGLPDKQIITFSKIEVDPTIDDSRFQMPPPAQPAPQPALPR